MSEAYMFSGDHREKPVPPLPLKIRRSSISSYRSDCTLGLPSDSELQSRKGVEEHGTPASDAPTARQSWKSLNLKNPFKRSKRATSPTSSDLSSSTGVSAYFAPALPLSRKMSRSLNTSSSSQSSTSTVSVPFYPSTFYKAFRSSTNLPMNQEKLGMASILEGVRSRGAGEKVTAKFPEAQGKEGKESWTWFKVVLLLSIITVSQRHPFQ